MYRPIGDLSGDWHIQLLGADVTLVMLDQRVSITVTDETLDELDIVLAGPFITRIGAGQPSATLDPSGSDPKLGLFAVSLKTRQLVECRGTSTGTLLLQFADGTSVEAGPSVDYEAWEVTYMKSEHDTTFFKVVCLPGGERAVWGGNPEER